MPRKKISKTKPKRSVTEAEQNPAAVDVKSLSRVLVKKEKKKKK